MLTGTNQSVRNSIVLLKYVTPIAAAWLCLALYIDSQLVALAAGLATIGCMLGMFTHRLGWHYIARFSYIGSCNLAIAFGSLFMPFESFVSLIFVAAAVVPFVVFSPSKEQSLIFGFALFSIFLWLAVWSAHFSTSISLTVDFEVNNKILSLASAITVFSVVLFVIGFFLRLAMIKTERLREAIADANKAGEAQRLFLQSISHEILTPLHAISGFADILRFDAKSGRAIKQENVVSYSDQIVKSSQEMFRMIESMMDFVNFDGEYVQERFEKISVEQCVKSVAERFDVRLEEKRLNIQYDIDQDFQIIADEGGFRTILNQLLDNAVKFSRPDGNITISSSKLPDGTAELLIMDNGLGFPAGAADKAFIPFERLSYTTSDKSGFGVGLPLSQSIAKAMGFEIEIDETAMDGGHVRIIFRNQ